MKANRTAVFAFITQPIVAEGLAKVMDDTPDLVFVGYSADPKSVVDELAESGAGLFLVDQAMGLRVVFDLLAALKRSLSTARPVLWAREISPADRRLALEAGARGVLDRTFPVAALLDCLRAVAEGRVWVGDPDGTADLGPRGGHRLTQREREVVALVRAGLKNREIAQRLSITPGTVKVHLMHVFEKTGARDRFELRMQASRLLDPAPQPDASTTAAAGGAR